MGVYGMMQPIIEKLMEVGKKSRRRELTFREHENIIMDQTRNIKCSLITFRIKNSITELNCQTILRKTLL
jgi:hypothetical protein